MKTRIREKKHRLPEEYYRGDAVVAFTLCLRNRQGRQAQAEACGYPNMMGNQMNTQAEACGYEDTWSGGTEPDLVEMFTRTLSAAAKEAGCVVPVYCFMPDHHHLMIAGENGNADILKAIKAYKQKSGYWMARNRPDICWQKDFYDHVIKLREDIPAQVRYILDNPVRKGIVASWREYPYKGAIGCELEDVLHGIM